MNVRRIVRSDHVVGWAFAFPAVALLIAFGIVPIVWSALMSFQKTNLLSTPEWIGLANYRALPKDPLFKTSMVHAAIYAALFVPLSVGGGLFAAVALNRRIRGIRFYRLAVFVPVVVSTIATSIMFLWLFDPNFGLANWLLGKVGLGPFGFFTSSSGALYSIIVMTVWGWIGFDAIIYLAALQGVPQELLEAAAIDGARTWSIFRNVTLPLLGPATLFLVVFSSINALQVFDEVFFLTEGRTRHGDVRSRALPVQARVRAGHRGIRGGDRVRPAHRDPAPHGDPTLGGQADGVLRVMSASAELRDDALLQPIEDVSTGDPEPRRFLFSPWHLVLIPLAIVMLIPMIWMVITSFETLNETRHFPPILIPSSIQWQNYTDVLQQAPFARWFVNTLVVTVVVVAGNLLFCSLAGYAFARIKFFGRDVVFILVLATLMIPFQVIMIPTFIIVRKLGLIDTLGALIVPNLAGAFGIFLLRQFFRSLPIELEEAARIDGASRLGVLFKIVLPLSGPVLATVAVVTFLWTWNDFLWPLVTIYSPNNMTLQLGLTTFQGAHSTNTHLLMAANVMSVLPVLFLFVFAQRFFIRGIATSGLKG